MTDQSLAQESPLEPIGDSFASGGAYEGNPLELSPQPVPLREQIAKIVDKNAITECQQKCPSLEDSETCGFCKADQILTLSPLKELLRSLAKAGNIQRLEDTLVALDMQSVEILALLAKLEQGKLVELDADQSFPEPDITINSFPEGCNEVCQQVEQQNMFNANFRRIKQPEATDSEDIKP